MKTVYEFELPKDRFEHRLCINAEDFHDLLIGVSEICRAYIKWKEEPTLDGFIEEVEQKLSEKNWQETLE